MPKPTDEDRIALKVLREQFDDLYAEVMLDGEIDEETERPLLDLVEANIKKLETKMAKAKSKGRRGITEDTAKAAWDAYDKPYDKLQYLFTLMEAESHTLEPDMRDFMDKIQDAESAKDWDEALAQAILCTAWVDEQNLFEDFEVNDTEEEAEEDSSKAAWEVLADSNLLEDLRATHEILVELKHPKAKALGKYVKAIDKALEDDDFAVAVRTARLADVYAEDHDLWNGISIYGDEEEENPALVAWKKHDEMVMPLIRKAYADLVAAESEYAPLLKVFLDNIARFVVDEEYEKALAEAVQAEKWLGDNELWDAKPEPSDANWSDSNAESLDELNALHRRLKRAKHEKAADLKAKIDAIETALDDKQWFPAVRHLQDTNRYAGDEALWEAAPPTDKDDLAEIWWDTNGANYKKIKKLVATLEVMDSEHADAFREDVDQMDKRIDEETLFAAGMILDGLIETADEEKLWSVQPPKPDPADEISAKATWLGLDKEYGELQYLEIALVDMKHEKAADISAMVGKIMKAEEAEDYEAAERHLSAARATASALGLWDLVEIEEGGETTEPKNPWEARRSDYDEVVALNERLTKAMHPNAAEIGSLLTVIADAVDAEEWQEALDTLDRAREIADRNGLWDYSPADGVITASVGRKGLNKAKDVELVQRLLNQNGAKLEPDGACGSKTIAAIEKFQMKNLGFKDGRVDLNGKTWSALNGGSIVDTVKKVVSSVADAATEAADEFADTAESMWDSVVDFVTGEDDEEEVQH